MPLQRTLPRWLATPQGQLEDLQTWRDRVLVLLLRALMVLGSLVALPNMVLALSKGLWWIAVADTLALAWVLLLWRQSHWPLQRRAWLFCGLLYAIGLALLISIGSTSQIYLMAVPVMAALLLGLRPALLALGLNAITVLVAGYLGDANVYLPGLEQQPLLRWVVITLNFTFVNAVMTLTSVMLLQGLEKTLTRLRDSEALYRATVENAPIGVSRLDLQGRCLQVNRKLCDITGYRADELIARHDQHLMHPQDAELAQAHTQALLQGEQDSSDTELRYRKKNGDTVWVHLRRSLVRTQGGKPLHVVTAITDITARKIAERRLSELAFYDPLTALPNRALLLERLKTALLGCARHAGHGALLYLNLDHFKRLNDTAGHDVGDQLLQQVAVRLLGCVRGDDTVARLDGDEFLILIEHLSAQPNEAAEQSERVADKILTSLNQPFELDNATLASPASIGVTLFCNPRSDVEALIKQADLAMFKAKSAGRKQARFFDPAMQAAVQARTTLEAELREAVATHQFLVYYQPQVDRDGRLSGAEALVRWQHPTRGLVPPGEFIPVAEETGLIAPMGQWVLHTACAQLARWAALPGHAALTMAVNVSASQFHQADFVAQVQAALSSTGANPRALKLELTESMLVSSVDEITAKMRELKQVGVSFSLDDFGTGYSSLTYLKRLPLDQLKIDQSFVRDVLTDPNDAAIAHTVVALAQSLGLDVIAEGVETMAQRDALAAMGCYAYQGYGFSRPLPPADFDAWACINLATTSPPDDHAHL